jgi:hypothetical protein
MMQATADGTRPVCRSMLFGSALPKERCLGYFEVVLLRLCFYFSDECIRVFLTLI